MKLCRNCRTINEDTAMACVRCKMRDQLVSYNPEATKEWQTAMHKKNQVALAQNVCMNCGTTDYGNSDRCNRCRFPLKIKKRDA